MYSASDYPNDNGESSAMIYLYLITNKINLKKYVGQTNNPKQRWRTHKSSARNGVDFALYRAFRKYGINNFSFEVIATCLKDEHSTETEMLLIKQHKSFGNNGYNMTPGDSSTRGLKWTRLQRDKRSGSGNPRYNKSPWNKGIKCQEISKIKTGSKNPNAKIWKIYFSNRESLITKERASWSRKNGYNDRCISNVFTRKQKKHKNIIKVEQIKYLLPVRDYSHFFYTDCRTPWG